MKTDIHSSNKNILNLGIHPIGKIKILKVENHGIFMKDIK